jgi:hypothetical protein
MYNGARGITGAHVTMWLIEIYWWFREFSRAVGTSILYAVTFPQQNKARSKNQINVPKFESLRYFESGLYSSSVRQFDNFGVINVAGCTDVVQNYQ